MANNGTHKQLCVPFCLYLIGVNVVLQTDQSFHPLFKVCPVLVLLRGLFHSPPKGSNKQRDMAFSARHSTINIHWLEIYCRQLLEPNPN